MEPSVMTLYIPTSAVGAAGITEFCDLSQIASIVNRRFYRQGINWAVAGIKVLNQTGYSGAVTISKLPNTWVLSNAWTKSFKAWQKMNSQALAESESVRPKFLDFKIYADADHHTSGYGANLLPWSGTGPFTAGEWVASKYVIPDSSNPGNSTEREVIAVGASFPGNGAFGLNAVSMIEGYASSRGLPYQEDPNAPADAGDAKGSQPENWMAALFNDGTSQDDAVLDDMISENNQAPYPFEGDGVNIDTMYPGGANQGTGMQIHDIAFVSGTTIGGTSHIKGGNFPCGLIRIDATNTGTTSNLVLMIDLIPGNHRGYLCEPMMEM